MTAPAHRSKVVSVRTQVLEIMRERIIFWAEKWAEARRRASRTRDEWDRRDEFAYWHGMFAVQTAYRRLLSSEAGA